MECLTIAKVLVLAFLIVVISGLYMFIAAGVHHLMVARKRQRAGHKKERKIRYPINIYSATHILHAHAARMSLKILFVKVE
jgi:hypothetical protein